MENENGSTAQTTAIIYTVNVPIGTVMPFMGKREKLAGLRAQGWHYCNGEPRNTSTYNDLFEMIGYSCGGNGTDFNLPDMRGVFVRGVDDGRKQDPDADKRTKQGSSEVVNDGVGTYQKDQFESHRHTTNAWVNERLDIRNDGDSFKPANVSKDLESTFTGGSETRPKNISAFYIIFAGKE
jgi:microcystin-dependent protein